MMSFKDWFLVEEDMPQTSQVYLGGLARAKRNDNQRIGRYDPAMATGPSTPNADNPLPPEAKGWILKFANQGLTPENIAVKLKRLRKIDVSPQRIKDMLQIIRLAGDVKPTFRIGPVAQAPAPEYTRWNPSPEIKDHIKRYHLRGVGPKEIWKQLKKMGHDVSGDWLDKYVHMLKYGEEV